MTKSLIFGGGVPTEIDVRRLLEAFGIPAIGQLLTYDQISGALGLDRQSWRWHTVTGAWRKRLYREHNLVLSAIAKTGFKVEDSRGRVGVSASKYRGGLRRIAAASIMAARTDRAELTPEESAACDHIQNTGAALRLAAATAARQIKHEG